MNIKKILVEATVGVLILGSLAIPAFATQPTGAGLNVPDSAQCGSGASSGAFNFQNKVYGVTSSGNSDNFNSSGFGLDGGSGGGQTGINNSSVCGNN